MKICQDEVIDGSANNDGINDPQDDVTDNLLQQDKISEPRSITQNPNKNEVIQTTTYCFIENTSSRNAEDVEEISGQVEVTKIHGNSTEGNIDPHFTGSNQKPTTYLETFTHFLKGNIGVGMMAMGMAYKNGGILISTILVLMMGILSWYNQYKLVQMTNKFQSHYNCGPLGFAQSIQFAFERGPPAFQKSATFLRFSIELSIIVIQLGFCCVYFTFVASSLQLLLNQYGIFISTSWLMTIALPVFWTTSLVRDLKYIAPFSTLANVSILSAIALIMINNVQNLPPISQRPLVGMWKTIPLCFGTVMYSIEGISLVLPLQQNMKKKEQFLGACGVLNLTYGIVVSLLIMVGLFGYYKHGDAVGVSLTFNLNNESIITQIVIGALVLSVLCTYSIQMFVPVFIMLPWVRKRTSTRPCGDSHLYEYLFRSLLVLLTYSVVMVVPHLDLLVSLMGAVSGTLLSLIYVPLAEFGLSKYKKGGHRSCNLFLPTLSLLVGTIGFVFGTTTSLTELIFAVRYGRTSES